MAESSSLVRRKPQVWIDLVELADYLARDNLDVAIQFLESAESTFQFSADSPDVGNPCLFENSILQNMRRWNVQGFRNHLIFYEPISAGIEIIRVIHASSDIEMIFES